MLPGDFIGVAVDRGKRAGKRRADRRRLGAADIAQPVFIGVAVAHKGAGADRARHIEIAGIGIVGHWRPIGAALPAGLDQQRRLPKRGKDAAGVVDSRAAAWRRCGTVLSPTGKGWVFAVFWRGSCGTGFFLDADQRFAVGAVEDIDPAGAPGLGDALARLAVDDRVEQHDRARRVIVPDVVVHFLEMPDIFAGLGFRAMIEAQNRLSPSRTEPL